MISYHNKVVVITGGAGGIGFALAQCYAGEGASIALLDLHQAAIDKRVDELNKRGIQVIGLACDITSAEESASSIQQVEDVLGGIDVLIHCAGLTQVGPFLENDLEVYRRTMDVNFFGSLHTTKAALGSLVERKGQIIVLSSIAGFAPLLGRTGYCASKHALHGFFDTLRCELEDKNVGVTIACPSFVRTDFSKSGLGADGKALTFDRSTTGVTTSPESVAQFIVEAARKRKPLIVISRTGKLAYWLTRFLPSFYARGMTKRFKVELDR